jgi:hypothetical protein
MNFFFALRRQLSLEVAGMRKKTGARARIDVFIGAADRMRAGDIGMRESNPQPTILLELRHRTKRAEHRSKPVEYRTS